MKVRFLIAAAAVFLLGGCAGGVFLGGPYLGGFGPYYSDGWGYDRDFVVHGDHYHHYSGLHHFMGHNVAVHHFGGFHGGGFHGGGFHGGGGRR